VRRVAVSASGWPAHGWAVFQLLLCLLVLPASGAADDAADVLLSPIAREVFEELNLARTDPEGYADVLAEMKQHFNGNALERPGQVTLITQEGVAAFDEAIAFLRSTHPLPALRISKGLSLAAKAHVEDQRGGAMGHDGSDASKPWERMSRYGVWRDAVAENIAYGGYSTRGVVVQLIVDDGVPDRQHRVNIYNPEYRYVGIACGPHGRLHDMCVMDFAADYSERTGP
jgi:uncharacterized protein YkwD